MTCHSRTIRTTCLTIDHCAIVTLIVASHYPILYYGFCHHPHSRIFYIIVITLVGLVVGVIIAGPKYQMPANRKVKLAFLIGLGFCGFVPLSHLFAVHGARGLFSELGIGWLLTSSGIYSLGIILISYHIPECWIPGRLDYFLTSHQIFHICVILGALAHYRCSLQSLHYCVGRD